MLSCGQSCQWFKRNAYNLAIVAHHRKSPIPTATSCSTLGQFAHRRSQEQHRSPNLFNKSKTYIKNKTTPHLVKELQPEDFINYYAYLTQFCKKGFLLTISILYPPTKSAYTPLRKMKKKRTPPEKRKWKKRTPPLWKMQKQANVFLPPNLPTPVT